MGNMLTDITLTHYLVVSAILFCAGLCVVMTRRNAIGVLMGLELILNAAAVNFVAFNKYSAAERLDGQVMTIFVIIIAAAEAAAALAIVLNLYQQMNNVQIDTANVLKD